MAALSQAMASGDASLVTLPTVMSAAKAQLAGRITAHGAARQALWGLGSGATPADGITWDPSHDSVTFNVLDSARNHVVLASNWKFKGSTAGSGATLAVAGQAPASGTRYAAFGGNPMAVAGNAAMDQFMRNTVSWLTQRTDLGNLKVVTAHLPGKATYWFPHETKLRDWIATRMPGATVNGLPAAQAVADDACDGDKLDACLQGADLLVIGRQQGPNIGNSNSPDNYPAGQDGATVMQAVAAAQARGTPVLYLHHYRDANDLATRMLDYLGLGITNNYWAEEGLSDVRAADLPATPGRCGAAAGAAGSAGAGQLQHHLERLRQRSRQDAVRAQRQLRRRRRAERRVRRHRQGAAQPPAQPGRAGRAAVRPRRLRAGKAAGAAGRQVPRIGELPAGQGLGGRRFLPRLFLRHGGHHQPRRRHRGAQPRQLLRPVRGRHAHRVAPHRCGRTGHPPPGASHRPVRDARPQRDHLAREDTSAASVTVGLNLLRDSTRLYNTNGYDRPTQLASPRVALKSGQPLTITSPFGGPLILFIEPVTGAATPPVVQVQVQVDGATTHPLLRDPSDAAQVAAFRAELDSTPTNWVSVRTDFLTVHSTLANFRQSVAAQGGVESLVAGIVKYMVKANYELAGFNSATAGAFSLPPEAAAFCQANGWDCTGTQHRRDLMQHFISDVVATCGAGCSGNPIDSNSPVEPAGSLENHEIGHNIQPERLRIYGGLSGEVSNNIFPVHTQLLFNQATTGPRKTYHRGSAKTAFDLIKSSHASADPAAHMKAQIWTDSAYAANGSMRLTFYRQLVEYARHYNTALGDGWSLYTLMYLLDRNFDAATGNWPTAAAGLGFGTYATQPSTIDGNDFMLIASSRIIGRDMRPVFDMWGITSSAAARNQVAAYALPAAGKLLFPMADMTQSGAGIGAPVTMAADAAYPAGY